jgi:hypothetical protein
VKQVDYREIATDIFKIRKYCLIKHETLSQLKFPPQNYSTVANDSSPKVCISLNCFDLRGPVKKEMEGASEARSRGKTNLGARLDLSSADFGRAGYTTNRTVPSYHIDSVLWQGQNGNMQEIHPNGYIQINHGRGHQSKLALIQHMGNEARSQV